MDLSFFKQKKILITGHTGFKGSWLVKLLDRLGAEVYGYALAPGTSPSLFEELGLEKEMGDRSFIGDIRDLERLKAVFSAVQPELVIHLEVRDVAAYVHASPVDGAGGMPVGSNGVAISLLSGGIDSPVSTYMIARRGVRLVPLHFFSFPYTSEAAKEKVVELARLLTPYCGKMPLLVVPFTHIQEQIRDKCPEEYFTLIMRRFMMRIAEKIAEAQGAKAIVTGENLGQVASQTMEAMASTQAVISLPVLQPLIGMDKEEIVRFARRIGTFETSILPYEDCCTVFTPRHPKTHPKVEEVERAEREMDVDGLVAEAVAGVERIMVGR